MRHLLPCPPCGRQGRPGQGFLAGFIERPRGSAPRERDHRGGDHPVPSRTRQLSPPSPRVLQREAAGGQGVALAEGAFLLRRSSAGPRRAGARRFRGVRRVRRERPAGGIALRASPRFEQHCPAWRRDPRRGPPTWPAFVVSGACAPSEWMDFFVSADGMTIAPVLPGLFLLLGLFGI